MKTITKMGIAGTLESNDIVITVAPADKGSGITIELTSPVIKQYGRVINEVITDETKKNGVTDVAINANDKGALDCTIRARVKTALSRALA